MQFYRCILAEACGAGGKAWEGMSLLDEAFAVVARTGTQRHVPELHRTRGELLLKLDPDDVLAEHSLRQALSTARSQGARSMELRAASGLARLYLTRDRRAEGRDVLLPIYEWFTEGHGTGDLVAAKALLEQLR
jgi:predicted ATPase